MPVLTISEIVSGELSRMQFVFGGTPADVVEYPDGGRKASGQALTVDGLNITTEEWISQQPSIVPTADGNGCIPEFRGPAGILALRVDFGYGSVILRADAANLHAELRTILIDRLSQLQVDEDNFRTSVSTEIDAMRTQIDSVVTSTLDQVSDLISQQQDAVIQQAVDDKLATDLAPTLSAAIDDAMENRVPPLIDEKVPPVVAAEVASQTTSLQTDISNMQVQVDAIGVKADNTQYQVDGLRNSLNALTGRVSSVESQVFVATFSPPDRTFSDVVISIRLEKFNNMVFAFMRADSRTTDKGPLGWVPRVGMGIPSQFLPAWEAAFPAAATFANGAQVSGEFRLGITTDGQVATQGNANWNRLVASWHYFTS